MSSGATSASCYDGVKEIRVFPVVVPERKLGEVQRQVLLADLMIIPNDATLQETPEVVQRVRVNRATRVSRQRDPNYSMAAHDLNDALYRP